jgi:hypothetical protein
MTLITPALEIPLVVGPAVACRGCADDEHQTQCEDRPPPGVSAQGAAA